MDSLPNEILINILSKLDIRSLFKCRIICKSFRKLLYTNATWYAYYSFHGIPYETLWKGDALHQTYPRDIPKIHVVDLPQIHYMYVRQKIVVRALTDFLNSQIAGEDGWTDEFPFYIFYRESECECSLY